ncbi:MAG: beta-N-acetylhexosaminidase, partial [Thermoproteota archaeon]
MEKDVKIVPEPKEQEFSGKWFEFDGISLPDFLSKEFNIPHGSWKIVKTTGYGSGVHVKGECKEVAIWGDDNVCYATIIQLLKQNPGYIP